MLLNSIGIVKLGLGSLWEGGNNVAINTRANGVNEIGPAWALEKQWLFPFIELL